MLQPVLAPAVVVGGPAGGVLVISDVILEAIMGVLMRQAAANIAGEVVTQTVTNQIGQEVTKQVLTQAVTNQIEQEVAKQVVTQAVTNQIEQEVAKQVVTQTASLWLEAIPYIGWGITAVSLTYAGITILKTIKEGQEVKALLSKPDELTLEKVPAKYLDTAMAAVFVKVHGFNNPKGSSAFNQKLSQIRQAYYGNCSCKLTCACGPPCNCQSRKDEDTPITDGDKFDKIRPNGRGNAYRNNSTGEIFAEDTMHGDHYDVYKNLDEFKKKAKKALRKVFWNGFWNKDCC